MPYTNGKNKNNTRTRNKSVVTKNKVSKLKRGGSADKKKKIYISGAKKGQYTYTTNPNKNIMPSRKRR